MKIEDNLLDQLFDQAKNEKVMHSFSDTKTTFINALAVGVISALGLKTITSSILKTKFFIMSISTITILTSTAIIYQVAVKKPNELAIQKTQHPIENIQTKDNSKVMTMSAPPNLFIAQNLPNNNTLNFPVAIDTPEVQKPVEIKDVEVIDSLESIQKSLEEAKETLKTLEISDEISEIISKALNEVKAELSQIDLEKIHNELVVNLEELELSNKIEEAVIKAVQIIDNHVILIKNKNNCEDIMLNKDSENLTKKSFNITTDSDEHDIQIIRNKAEKAGIDFRYNLTSWKNERIKKLDIYMVIDDCKYVTQKQSVHLSKINKREKFSLSISWYENKDGQAIKFSNSKCSSITCR